MEQKYDKIADFDNRIIYLYDEITDESVFYVIHALRKMETKQGGIIIQLNSPGGYDSAAYSLYDSICLCMNSIRIDVIGSCHSHALTILQAADIRRATTNSDFLIHSGFAGNDENVKQHEVIELADNLKKSNSRYNEIVAGRSKFSVQKVEELCMHESYFNAQEALKFGLIDEIIQPNKTYKKKKTKKENK